MAGICTYKDNKFLEENQNSLLIILSYVSKLRSQWPLITND